jgi:hypothetical protein
MNQRNPVSLAHLRESTNAYSRIVYQGTLAQKASKSLWAWAELDW